MRVPINRVGKILAGDEAGRFIKVLDDSGSTGGFLILTSPSPARWPSPACRSPSRNSGVDLRWTTSGGLAKKVVMLLLALLSLASGTQAHSAAIEAVEACASDVSGLPVYRVGHAVCIRGQTDAALAKSFLRLRPTAADIVVASGPGGEITPAMDIGDYIYRHGLTTVVDQPCVSSCAYFIALGGHRLIFVGDGILGFHGGPVPEGDILKNDRFDAKTKQSLIQENRRFAQFFRRRNIDLKLTYDVPESLKKQTDWAETMWTRSAEELRRYGVKSIVYCSGLSCSSQQVTPE